MTRKKKDMIEISKTDILTVETYNGRVVPKENCKRIDNNYYEVNVDCFLIVNKQGIPRWNRINNGRIGYDYELKKWDLLENLREKQGYTEGIIDDKETKGYFLINPYKNVILTENIRDSGKLGMLCINEEVAEKLGYTEYFGTGLFIKNTEGHSKATLKKKTYYKYEELKGLKYNADDNNRVFMDVVKEYSEVKSKMSLEGNVTQAAKLLGNLTFGIEYETSGGIIPKHMLGPLGLVPLKDGSLRDEHGNEPYEYATVPLHGEFGLQSLKLQCEELQKRCTFNEKCSLHIHIGGVKTRTMEFILALYKLGFNIQDEVFSIFPDYKSYPEKYGYHKNYCQKLKDINLDQFKFNRNYATAKEAKDIVKSAFDQIYYWASDNTVPVTDENYGIKSYKHPKGELDKWNYVARYYWINFNNYLFSKRETLEFRLHTPSFNSIKVSNWLFIVSAIIQYAECYTNEILRNEINFKLENILTCYSNSFGKSFYENEYATRASNYLIEYCKLRKELIKKDNENGDGWGNSLEFKKDSKFIFESQGLNSIY